MLLHIHILGCHFNGIQFQVSVIITVKLYGKREDLDFELINFPSLTSNILVGPAYGVYISQLLRYCRACDSYEDF